MGDRQLGDAMRRVIAGHGTDEDRVALALDHASRLNADERPAVPVRPSSLPTDDELLDMHERQTRGERLGAVEDKQMGRLSAWRGAVFRHESQCAGKILGILYTARTLVGAGQVAAAERVASFLHVEYGITEVPADANDDRELAQRKASRVDVLPLVLRTMKRVRERTAP